MDAAKRLVRVYPAALVRDGDGVETTISLQWLEEYGSQVELLGYTLLLYYQDGSKEERFFSSYEAMIAHLHGLADSS
ncbi:MAG: hypothetical protein C6I00_01760 [Nitratiruptor sp.]|nr:hypothetical protein [Nitratiruptor sp.]NPA83325.1 hypothetical protein [Campylobacterota bacterium]